MKLLFDLLVNSGVKGTYAFITAAVAALAGFGMFLWVTAYLCKKLFEKFIIDKFFKGISKNWYNALRESKFFNVLGWLLAGFLGKILLPVFFPDEYAKFHALGVKIASIYIQVCVLILINKIMDIIIFFHGHNPKMPVKGIMQALKLLINFFGTLVILAWMLGKEPALFISALSAVAAVLMLVFKDPILGLAASFQLSFNDMLRIGDWIEMPKHGADGDVIDISLTSVRVQNWDKTIVSIPAYDLISSSFKNWRGMQDSGGRRIKRAINIDVQSIKFVTPEMFDKLHKIDLLADYLDRKKKEIETHNAGKKISESIRNGRYLTNLGTFRAYCEAYINSRDYIHSSYTQMVRQLHPTSEGLPLEIYCFTNTTAWIEYEADQSDLFDHLYSVMEDFELRPFQNPSGGNLIAVAHELRRDLNRP